MNKILCQINNYDREKFIYLFIFVCIFACLNKHEQIVFLSVWFIYILNIKQNLECSLLTTLLFIEIQNYI